MLKDNPFLSKKILVVTAHPDDEAYFAGALRQAVDSGGQVRLLCGTLGERGRSYVAYECTTDELKKLRRAELDAAAKAIGMSQVVIGGYPDGALSDYTQNFVVDIERVVAGYGPDIIVGYGPDGYTGHADHVAAYAAACSVAQARHLPYVAFALPPEPYRTELMQLLNAKRKLGVYVDSTQVVEASVAVAADAVFKLELLRHHTSQLQGLNPYTAFGEVLGGHLMQYEYFHILS